MYLILFVTLGFVTKTVVLLPNSEIKLGKERWRRPTWEQEPPQKPDNLISVRNEGGTLRIVYQTYEKFGNTWRWVKTTKEYSHSEFEEYLKTFKEMLFIRPVLGLPVRLVQVT